MASFAISDCNTGDSSLIRWQLEVRPKSFQTWTSAVAPF